MLSGGRLIAEASEGRPRPDDGGATRLSMAMALLDVDEVNTAEQNFTANLMIVVSWSDPRQAHDGERTITKALDEVWHPGLFFVNQQKIWPSLPSLVRITPEGEVSFLQRVWGPFSQPLDVRNFPFDSQDFEIRVASVRYGAGEIEFAASLDRPSLLADAFSLPDWKVTGWELNFEPYQPTSWIEPLPSVRLIFSGKRHVSHYMLKVILPLVLITAMSWIVFWIDPAQSGTQIGVSTTSMLTLIAYQFMVGGLLPPVPYLTRMDLFIFGSTLLVFGSLVQAVATSLMHHRGYEVAARRLDLVCRVAVPGVYMLVLFLPFMLSHYVI